MYIDELFKKIDKKSKNIAKLKKMDLHIHTPASKDYIFSEEKYDTDNEYKKIINKFITSDLDVIAITDHNTIAGYKRIADIIKSDKDLEEKLSGKYIMLGIEITCFSRHFLIYFPDDISISLVEDFIRRCGIDYEKNNDIASADRVTPLILCELANEYNAFVCLPHADDDKGFLKDYIKDGKKDKEFLLNGGIVEKVLKCPNLLGICISYEKNKETIKDLTNNFNKNLKLFKASDSHSVFDKNTYKGPGKPMGTANIGELNFRAIKSFFKNPSTMIFDSIIKKENPYIMSICIKGGFIKNKSSDTEWAILPFSRELNCFIGARGTGKSTIIDILKYAFNFYDTEKYSDKPKDEYLIVNIDEIEKYDEFEEKENIINRFEEVVIFISKRDKVYALSIAPKNIQNPNITIYFFNDNKFIKKFNSVRLNSKNMNKIINFISEISPIIYQQKNILEIGNNKMKVTKTIYSIIQRIVGKDYKELLLKKEILQRQVDEQCRKIEFERKRDCNADNNSIELIRSYSDLLETAEKLNVYNIEIIKMINEVLKEKLLLTYEINLPQKYKESIILDIINENIKNNKISGYEREIKLKRDLNFLFGKLTDVHDLLYLLFTNQFDELAQKAGISSAVAESACNYVCKYLKFNYVSSIPQVLIDFKLNVNYGISKKSIFKQRTCLSFGQRAVGILLILLYGTSVLDGNLILILDQPEDDLDNSYVYHSLVKELNKVKEKRQLIVATHNSNIVVAGNSENILVLKGNGESGWLECNGTIYNKAVAADTISILEGNKIAFNERAELYDIFI